MDIRSLQATWDRFGREDPLWAVLSLPDKRGGRWDLEEFLATGVREVDGLLAWLDEVGAESGKAVALDFGCGVGRLTQPLAERFERAVGLDIAPSMIEVAREINRAGDRCTFVLNERDDLAVFEDASFDLIYSNITLQHMPPSLAKRYLKEMIRTLKPEGVLVFQLPERPPATLKARLKRLVPHGARARLRALGQRLGAAPRIQMYWMTAREVTMVVEGAGGSIVAMHDDWSGGPEWPGKRYAVKRARPAS